MKAAYEVYIQPSAQRLAKLLNKEVIEVQSDEDEYEIPVVTDGICNHKGAEEVEVPIEELRANWNTGDVEFFQDWVYAPVCKCGAVQNEMGEWYE